MYFLRKRLEIAACHRLNLSYESACANLHGHNWLVTVCCKSEKLNQDGMVVDFKHIKNIVNRLDHGNLNELLPCNPTAENIARWLCDNIPYCYRVEIQESEGNLAVFEK